MLKSLGLSKIQSHKETYIEFSPGFNVICGDSDSGKSAILRSVSWVWRNKPNGDTLKNWDCKKNDSIAVEMVMSDFDEDTSILKERKGRTASYTLSNYPSPFDVVGRDVPQEALDVINFSELNFRGQHDPYLLRLTPGQLAKMINDLVGLSSIDTSLAYLNRKANKLKSEVNTKINQIEAHSNEIENLQYLEKMNSEISELEELQSEYERIALKKESISKKVEAIEILQSEIQFNHDVLSAEKPSNEIYNLMERLKTASDKNNKINSLVLSIKDTEKKLEEEREWVKACEPSEEINLLMQKFSKVKSSRSSLESLISSVNSIKQALKIAQNSFNNVQKALREFLVKTDTCPVCYRKLDNHTIDEMVGHLK